MNIKEKNLLRGLSLKVESILTLDYTFNTYDEVVYTVKTPDGEKLYETGNIYCLEALITGYTTGREGVL